MSGEEEMGKKTGTQYIKAFELKIERLEKIKNPHHKTIKLIKDSKKYLVDLKQFIQKQT